MRSPTRSSCLWLEDGDHDLKPRKSISGFSTADHLKTVAEAVTAWAGKRRVWRRSSRKTSRIRLTDATYTIHPGPVECSAAQHLTEGSRGRRFESGHSDHFRNSQNP